MNLWKGANCMLNLSTEKMSLFASATILLRSYHYVYGMKESYNPLTQQRLDILAKQNKSIYDANYIKKAKKFIGQRCIDCSGLVCALWKISDIGSSQIADLPTREPANYKLIDAKRDKLKWGDCVWKRGHVGIYIEDGKVLEAKGINEGIRISTLENTPWIYAIRKKDLTLYENLGWNKDSTGKWWYAYGETKGEYLSGCTVDMEGKTYMFDKNGYLVE